MAGFWGTLGGAWTLDGAATTTGDGGAANIKLLVSTHADERNGRLTLGIEERRPHLAASPIGAPPSPLPEGACLERPVGPEL